MDPNRKIFASDDEEDLESLRLAALQTLKKTTVYPIGSNTSRVITKMTPSFNYAPHVTNKRGRGFYKGQNGRSSRNGPFGNRIRNTNLIPIPVTEPDKLLNVIDTNATKNGMKAAAPKLVLPQDRYCKKDVPLEKPAEPPSKFSRYDNSDNSESESELDEEADKSGTESPVKLQRSDSLEVLMQELENEIKGDSKPNESTEKPVKAKPKLKKMRKSKLTTITDNTLQAEAVSVNKEACIKGPVAFISETNENICDNIKDKQLPKLIRIDLKVPPPESPVDHHPCRSDILNYGGNPLVNVNTKTPYEYQSAPFQSAPFTSQNIIYNHNMPYDVNMPYHHNTPIYRSPPPRCDRPLSPLSLNTDVLSTITMAPLSPRSAAFVLQNREIIERRKMSPRRSYSRSPSPRFGRNKSPRPYRRSRSPRLSPVRSLPSRHGSPVSRALSPRRMSPYYSPVSPTWSPVEQLSPGRYRKSSPQMKTTSVHSRLGSRPYSSQPTSKTDLSDFDNSERRSRKRSRSLSISLSPSPERIRDVPSNENSLKVPENEESSEDIANNVLDPVLEARRRKFESKEIVQKEGKIRLKPSASDSQSLQNIEGNEASSQELLEEQERDIPDINEDELLEGDEIFVNINTKVDDLFSDEESDSENEGRFKSTGQKRTRDLPVLPFTQLLNGPNRSVRNELPEQKYRRERARRDRKRSNRLRRQDEPRDRNRRRSRSPLKIRTDKSSYGDKEKHINEQNDKVIQNKNDIKSEAKTYAKNRANLKSEVKRQPITSPIENRKIEIKIRNPAKYEVAKEKDVKETDKKQAARKVEVASAEEPKVDLDDHEPEIIVDNEDDEDEISVKSEGGDLRAQLSRKRAERQSKLPSVEVHTRLLQNALEGAVFKKSKKSKSARKERDVAPKDTKLPIYLRLGIANNSDIFCDTKTRKKRSKRNKNRGILEQV